MIDCNCSENCGLSVALINPLNYQSSALRAAICLPLEGGGTALSRDGGS